MILPSVLSEASSLVAERDKKSWEKEKKEKETKSKELIDKIVNSKREKKQERGNES